MWWHVPIIPATREAEAGELLNPEGGGCGEPRLSHCTPGWVTRAKFRLKKTTTTTNKQTKENRILFF